MHFCVVDWLQGQTCDRERACRASLCITVYWNWTQYTHGCLADNADSHWALAGSTITTLTNHLLPEAISHIFPALSLAPLSIYHARLRTLFPPAVSLFRMKYAWRRLDRHLSIMILPGIQAIQASTQYGVVTRSYERLRPSFSLLFRLLMMNLFLAYYSVDLPCRFSPFGLVPRSGAN